MWDLGYADKSLEPLSAPCVSIHKKMCGTALCSDCLSVCRRLLVCRYCVSIGMTVRNKCVDHMMDGLVTLW